MKENEILKVTFHFAVSIIEFCELLETNKKYIIARQLLRSGTAIGANVREAQNSESKADFLHKLKIAAKEMEETEYWLLLCKESNSYPFDENLLNQLQSIRKLLSAIISTLKKNLKS
jgi:four helix bundle protein